MRWLFLSLLFFFLLTGCQKDDAERLFEMIYPATDFEIPAGLGASLPRVFAREDVPTNIQLFMSNNGVEPEQITAIRPYAARLTSLENLDYEFVEEISVRICRTDAQVCGMGDEVFYIDNLQGRGGEEIDLLPSLRSDIPVLRDNSFRLEVVFFFRYTTPYSVRSRLDMSFEAVR